jgi:hypothetical protein
MEAEDLLLEKCRRLIEVKLGWGHSDIWTNHDFETLSQRIESATHVNLSAITLKRIWKRIKYESKPTIKTLDTLAQFVGFENWRVFKLSQSTTRIGNQPTPTLDEVDRIGTGSGDQQRRKRYVLLIPAAVVIIALPFWVFTYLKKEVYASHESSSELYTFSSKRIELAGVPNSVIFHYDAAAAGNDDTIFIQQSWDRRLRQPVNKNEHVATSIYYYPGFFVAKLVVNEEVVKVHNIHIRTQGWLPLVEQTNIPVYFKEDDVIRGNGVMSLPVGKLIENTIPMQPETPWVAFHNFGDFGNLKSDNFIFETELKNDYGEGAGICQQTEILIRWESGMLMVPLSIKGCVSGLGLIDMDGRKKDTSLLGCNFSDWVSVKVVVRDRRGELIINGKKAYDLNLDIPPSKIVGITYRFQGTGSVDAVRFSTLEGEVVYANTF